MINYCLPIIESEVAVLWELSRRARADYRFIEIWLDYIEPWRKGLVSELTSEFGEQLIFLFRRVGLEKIRLPFETRAEIMRELAGTQSYLDLDFLTQGEELAFIKKKGLDLKLILSYHNYIETPSWLSLRRLAHSMRRSRATVCKVAAMCNCPEDALRLLGLQMEFKRQGVRHIVLGMGVYGAVTRIFGTLWGNEMIFAPLTREGESAPGQLTRGELEQIFEILER